MASSAACRARKFFFGPLETIFASFDWLVGVCSLSDDDGGGGDDCDVSGVISSTIISGEEAGEICGSSFDVTFGADTAAAAVNAECASASEGKSRLIFFGSRVGLGRKAGLRVIGAIVGASFGVAVTVAIGSKLDLGCMLLVVLVEGDLLLETGVILYTGADAVASGKLTVIVDDW